MPEPSMADLHIPQLPMTAPPSTIPPQTLQPERNNNPAIWAKKISHVSAISIIASIANLETTSASASQPSLGGDRFDIRPTEHLLGRPVTSGMGTASLP